MKCLELIKNDLSQRYEKIRSISNYIKCAKNNYKNWYKIPVIFLFKLNDFLLLYDKKWNNLKLPANNQNLLMLLHFSKILNEMDSYEISGNNILVRYFGDEKEFKVEDILDGRGLLEINSFYLMKKFKIEPIAMDKNYYFIEFDGLNWKLRKFSRDITCGPLLIITNEPYEYKNWFLRIVNKNSLFVDIGANIGGYTIRGCKLGARVIAIEPDLDNFSILEENLRINNLNAKLFNVALGSKAGYLPLLAPAKYSTGTLSLVRGNILRGYVKVMQLDELIIPILDGEIELIKIDVEGFEIEVLRYAKETLRRTKYIMIEILPKSRKEVFRMLEKQGFYLIDMMKNNFLFKRR